MGEPMEDSSYQSPMEEVFSWVTPTSFKRKDVAMKRKCDDDSGYISPFSSLKINSPYKSNLDSHYESTATEDKSSTFSTMDIKSNITSSLDPNDKCHSHNSSLPSIGGYSDFMMDASLYSEPLSTNTELSSMCIVEAKEEPLESMEVYKTIQEDVSTSTDTFATPSSHPIPETSSSSTSPSRKRLARNLPRRKAHRSLDGYEKIDMLYQLGKRGNYVLALTKILDYLPTRDIAAMTMVSKTWKNIVLSDKKTKARWHKYILSRHENRENLGSNRRMKRSKDSLSSDSILSALNMRRNHSTPLHTRQPSSPPVSPSKARFHSFQKEAERLKEDEKLTQCPICRYASFYSVRDSVGRCQSPRCQFQFCMVCKSEGHQGTNCPSLIPLPTTPTKKSLSFSSKQSRRFLRRL